MRLDAGVATSVRLPPVLRRFAGGNAALDVEAGGVGEVLERLCVRWPELRERLLGAEGRLHPYLALFCNGVALPHTAETVLGEGDVLEIVAAAGGG